jgi:tetratricopeptide (TPR) repeat protein
VGDRAGEGGVYGNLGNANYLLGDYSKALEYHTQHLAIAKEVADRAVEGEAYGRLGTGYLYLNDVDKTVAYFEAKHVLARSLKVAHMAHLTLMRAQRTRRWYISG